MASAFAFPEVAGACMFASRMLKADRVLKTKSEIFFSDQRKGESALTDQVHGCISRKNLGRRPLAKKLFARTSSEMQAEGLENLIANLIFQACFSKVDLRDCKADISMPNLRRKSYCQILGATKKKSKNFSL